jgi:hypothetical protein
MMEEQHKEMLRNLIGGTYDNIENRHNQRAYQPGQLATEQEAATAQAAAKAMGINPSAPKALPPEVIAARELKEVPKINEVGVETLFGEDLISEKSLDEVILSYLAGDGEQA